MRRGTTPTLTFNPTVDLTDVEVIYLTFQQNKINVLELQKDRMTITPDTIEVHLTQEETMRLDHHCDLAMQFASRFADESTLRSNIIITTVDKILKNEVI